MSIRDENMKIIKTVVFKCSFNYHNNVIITLNNFLHPTKSLLIEEMSTRHFWKNLAKKYNGEH